MAEKLRVAEWFFEKFNFFFLSFCVIAVVIKEKSEKDDKTEVKNPFSCEVILIAQ